VPWIAVFAVYGKQTVKASGDRHPARPERVHYPDVDLIGERAESGFGFLRRSGDPYPADT
jgi:hypothetical protein